MWPFSPTRASLPSSSACCVRRSVSTAPRTAYPSSSSPSAPIPGSRSRPRWASPWWSTKGWSGCGTPTWWPCRHCRGARRRPSRFSTRSGRPMTEGRGSCRSAVAPSPSARPECTTHWMYTEELQRLFPLAKVVPEVLYVDTGQVVTSAGTAAGLDACLHIWRQEYGAAVASMVARRAVVPPHRDGGQAQFIARAVPACDADTLGPLLTWILENLAEDHSVDTLARRALMSPRTFARRFRDETGTTPHSWLTTQRVAAAEELLETTEQPVEWIATEVGFGNAAALRHHFQRVRGVSPLQYRRTFCPGPTEATA